MGEAINPAVIRWFESRAISSETVHRMGIYSGMRDASGEVALHPVGNVIAFPFLEGGRVVAEKYRAAPKRFWQRPNPRRTFYNSDILDDPALQQSTAALVIVEGELDCLSVLEAGYPFCVSVPNGAPPGRDRNGKVLTVPESANDIDPENDEHFNYVAVNWDRLERVKRIVIATDDDDNGRRRLAHSELVRRLGRVPLLVRRDARGLQDVHERRSAREIRRARGCRGSSLTRSHIP